MLVQCVLQGCNELLNHRDFLIASEVCNELHVCVSGGLSR